ncbi:uncharacterized protein LACBIDRAFT_333296 [Laccaria bicolor S238N-H82]|uniref:Predicted protein n=1 Tax=Laccaria bicolor (strain S238N-H82 / ATCC MYA-4686) TaxID=486041 RepID=B0DVH5_LACBS|nr:uncharacterized protein LACBIDRAFT_333296 [Laccaria bicolor S238N-H82]EDR01387.1 predicted protein [Laccaria bicolor S238N-H82]|eukprot:XP_001887932.1 predicted protein [Laccaria bicolor S238N-H82]
MISTLQHISILIACMQSLFVRFWATTKEGSVKEVQGGYSEAMTWGFYFNLDVEELSMGDRLRCRISQEPNALTATVLLTRQLRDLLICPRETGVVNYVQHQSIVRQNLYDTDLPI